jgi:protein O-GlcNAc transferase
LDRKTLLEIFHQQKAAIVLQVHEYRQRAIDELQERVNSGERKAETYIELARHHMQLRQLDIGITVLKEGIERCRPDELLYSEAIFAMEQGNRTEEAIVLARRAIELFPRLRYFRLWEALMLPVLYDTHVAINRYRARYSSGLRALEAWLRLDTPQERREALGAIRQHLNFYLGYQGCSDRALQERYAQLVHKIMAANYPQWVQPLDVSVCPFGDRIRVGYISAHFRNHSVTKLFLGWLREHNRREFEVFTYHNGRTVDAVTDEVRRMSDHFRHIPAVFEPLCQAVLSDNLHIAVFLDVRHRRMAMASALRLAPVQCLAWAHPITSGSPMMDYYLSGDLMEPENAQDHYCERLVRLPGIGVCYPKPVIPRPLLGKSRGDFGLGENRVVFLCCQSSFKYLPQHDDIFARIANRIPTSQFVFIALNDLVAKDFRKRLQRAFAVEGMESSDFCVLLPQLRPFDYWNLNLVSDVFLDSLEWSGGVTTLEAIACGLPIVTLPGQFMRGRHSFGILTQLGVTETIARDKQEYVEIAVRLGLDPEWRRQVLEHMKANYGRLYSDTKCVRGLEDFFRAAVRERINSNSLVS